MTPPSSEARHLLELEDRDWAAFKLLKEAPGIHPATALFHAQQYVEKCLKAVLVSHGAVFRRTHDLEELGHLLVSTGAEPPLSPETLATLNPFAVAHRYMDQGSEHVSIDDVENMGATIERWTIPHLG